ncbi:uncharacterized protein PG998_008722 [Apiospora kogelbergensis]|uniref:uncharacterized protein n=1 Tax=Apiospora kogelbergensis TaxID=1337665 RepID=UPI003130F47B
MFLFFNSPRKPVESSCFLPPDTLRLRRRDSAKMSSDAPEAVRPEYHPEEQYPQTFCSPDIRQPQYQHQQHHDGAATNKNGGIKTSTIADDSPINEKSTVTGKVCGLPRQTFVFLVILAIVVVAAAVGGGVGGAMAVR